MAAPARTVAHAVPDKLEAAHARYEALIEHRADVIVIIAGAMLDQACTQLARWRGEGLSLEKVTVNLSARQLAAGGLAHLIRRTLDRHHLQGGDLGLEITESSLAYLRQLPVDSLKVDRSFISGLGERPSDTELVRAVVSLGSGPSLAVVAEAVETDRHVDELAPLLRATLRGPARSA